MGKELQFGAVAAPLLDYALSKDSLSSFQRLGIPECLRNGFWNDTFGEDHLFSQNVWIVKVVLRVDKFINPRHNPELARKTHVSTSCV